MRLLGVIDQQDPSRYIGNSGVCLPNRQSTLVYLFLQCLRDKPLLVPLFLIARVLFCLPPAGCRNGLQNACA